MMADVHAGGGFRRQAVVSAVVLVVLAVLAVLAALPIAGDAYVLGVAARMMVFALFASSLNLVLGFAGMASLGHAVYFGVGAYTAAKLSLAGVSGFGLQLGMAGLAAAALAALFAPLILRASGAYLLMITLALAQVVWGIAYGWREFTGADDGLPGVRRPDSMLPWDISGDAGFYYLILLLFALLVAAMLVLTRSPFGLALVGIRENERRMAALGYPVGRYKYIACVLAGGMAGVAGAMLAWQNGFVGPSCLSVAYSATALIMVILGGAGTVFGPVIGAFLIVALENVISGLTERWMFVLGATYVLATLFAPEGLVGLWRRWAEHRS